MKDIFTGIWNAPASQIVDPLAAIFHMILNAVLVATGISIFVSVCLGIYLYFKFIR